ncbi:hypothetical protein AciX8_0949 [Granulicella mallensis MP5ACTX8]|uniref:Uncharacterized protein n=1 Tax=Granulicella mallensis (strain ATCC BAA-1857 / DSM 23137 / MP5ACTX8) TaxID=682795 RepID=G8NUE1_GRAMM|nr:hypothetical protein AciX8_0949 [Granulicella mallensis MP5ACTX8]
MFLLVAGAISAEIATAGWNNARNWNLSSTRYKRCEFDTPVALNSFGMSMPLLQTEV